MLNKLVVIVSLLTLFSILITNNSEALFFKKNKAEKKEASEKKGENKILVVEIYAQWCPACKNIQPALDLLLKDIKDIEFIQLDVTNPTSAAKSRDLAEELGIEDFYQLHKSKTSTVAVFVPSTKEIVKVFQNNNDVDDYKDAIQLAKTKEKAAGAYP